MLLALAFLLIADEPAPPEPQSETRFALSVTDEGAWAAGLRVPGPETGNLLLIQPSFSWRDGQRWRFSTSLAGVVDTQSETHAQLRVRETYLGFTTGDLDFSAGKRILRWGTGYAFTATGVLDPPLSAIDPTDRLNLREGREMVTAEWVQGRHALTAAWASAGLLQEHQPGMRETVAFRYNTLLAGFDTSLIVAHDRGRTTFTGANFTRVFGEAVEVHGEFAHGDTSAVLLGGKYTMRSGFGTIFEFYAPGSGRRYAFLRAAKSRLRELPGWKEWDVAASLVANLGDRSRILVLDVTRRMGNHLSFYGHAQAPSGKKWQSEYGMIPYAALVSAGFRVQL
ncbi:MAG: hypothetical protein ABSE56_16620 [Bryobacteraceae bacterium]|jgi:hypothetical protein